MAVQDSRVPGTTLAAWVKQELRASIARGDHRPDEPFVTQRQIVEDFGVSTTTAVRALNDLVAEGLVVRRRGQGTFVAAQPLAPAPASPEDGPLTIAYVSPDELGPHQVKLLGGLAAECARAGLRLVVAHTAGPQDEDDVLSQVVEAGAAGVVLFPHDRSEAATTVELMRRRGTPVVLVDRYFPALPTDAVVFDDDALGHDVTGALLDRGHRAVAVLWSEDDATSVRDRLAGHARALRERGLPELPERCALRRYADLPALRRHERLAEVLGGDEPVTALIGGNAPTMALAARDLLDSGTGFPGAVELASMDEDGPFDVSPLAVASAKLPTRQLGEEAVRLLHERLADPTGRPRHIVLPAEVHLAPAERGTLTLVGAAGAAGRPGAAGALVTSPAVARGLAASGGQAGAAGAAPAG